MTRRYFYYCNKSLAIANPATMFWSAKNINQADSTSVVSWKNTGSGGAGYDLAPWYDSSPVFKSSIGEPAYVRFEASPMITTANISSTLTANNNRTIGIYLNNESYANKNILGYGKQYHGGLFDIMAYGGTYLVPHTYGHESYANIPTHVNYWGILELRYINNIIEVFNDGVLVNTIYNVLTTDISPLVLGGGMFAGYNNNAVTKIAAAYVADKALTDAEMQTMRNLML